MGTSNWQNLSYCVQKIRDINPFSILDVGIGFGRWGMLCREFLDVWNGRVYPESWQVKIVGIEIFKKNIQPYHNTFYNTVINSDAYGYIKEMNEHYNLIILGDVLEHFKKERAKTLLEICMKKADFIMLNIPLGNYWPQDVLQENEFEKHLSTWDADELLTKDCVEHSYFNDFLGRKFGVFIYSTSGKKSLPNKHSAIYRLLKKVSLFPLPQKILKKYLSR